MKSSLDHLKNHIDYPVDRVELIAACNNMSDLNEEDRAWFNSTIPEGDYTNPHDVVMALLNKL